MQWTIIKQEHKGKHWYNANCLRRQFSHDTDLTWTTVKSDFTNHPHANDDDDHDNVEADSLYIS